MLKIHGEVMIEKVLFFFTEAESILTGDTMNVVCTFHILVGTLGIL